ncbi:Crp/Fnr family transcriptional regulator, partial [Variovorax sp. 2RAF20]
MQKQENPKANHLLAVLPEAEWARLTPQLVPVDLPLGQVIYESGDRLE